MSTTAVPVEVKKTAKIPALNPWMAPMIICPNRDCYAVLTPSIGKEKRGGEAILVYTCEHCQYDFKMSLTHANGECKPIGTLDRPSLPEPFQK